MKILLISPQTPDTFWSFKHVLRFVSKRASFPPLGLLTVAAMLPPEWDLRLVDLNVKRLKDADLRWADFVMISAMIVQKESVRNIVARCRHQGKPVIAGGPLFTTGYEAFPEIRISCWGRRRKSCRRWWKICGTTGCNTFTKRHAGRTWRKRPFRAGI